MSKHDLLIIGAGLAGLRAAVEGVRQGLNVAVITKVHPVRSHSNAAQGGINAALTDRGDDWRDTPSQQLKVVIIWLIKMLLKLCVEKQETP